VQLITVEGVRYLPQAKSLNTLLNFLARREASDRGAHEALLHRAGLVTEGASSNFFIVQNGRLVTAPAEMVLPGVTRALVLDLAREASIPVEERSIRLHEMGDWDEAFITSTSRKVLPVTRLDGGSIGNGRVGPLTGRLIGIFETYDRQYLIDHTATGQGTVPLRAVE
jgi:D-alanine transaminase